jgi:RHH-type proline utilization regulon transcriptional repressor/proline dehydrogenase/delta 1-pyrroline-5-carboxylate dehydrogenase
MGFNIDAEEADRLDLSLDVIAAVLADPELAGWDGFGVVVQAYGKRAGRCSTGSMALPKASTARSWCAWSRAPTGTAEIKRAQVLGLAGFPVFTRKAATDVSYIANARKLLGMTDRIYPQFATHNAHTVAAILHMAKPGVTAFEFQRLHGMGERLHDIVHRSEGTRCRIYAPVGAHRDLLAYLVRRLLENGANSSFVHRSSTIRGARTGGRAMPDHAGRGNVARRCQRCHPQSAGPVRPGTQTRQGLRPDRSGTLARIEGRARPIAAAEFTAQLPIIAGKVVGLMPREALNPANGARSAACATPAAKMWRRRSWRRCRAHLGCNRRRTRRRILAPRRRSL